LSSIWPSSQECGFDICPPCVTRPLRYRYSLVCCNELPLAPCVPLVIIPEADTDEERLIAATRGDAVAVAALYSSHKRRLYSFVYRWTRDAEAAEDLTHDVFLRLLRPGVRYDGTGKAMAFLCRIAKNLATDRFRSLIESDALDDEYAGESSPSTLDRLVAAEDNAQLEAALARLRPEQRHVLLLTSTLRLSHREIGFELGCSEGAARVRVHRALNALRREWHAAGGSNDSRI
jgi:RNA polymerase sigma factor (sigma-70 family)